MTRLYSNLLPFLLAMILWLSVAVGIGAAEKSITLSITDGLVGESAYRVMTDHGGRVWVATVNGVNMYNGKSINAYSLTDEEHRLVTVFDICETRDKSVYAATDHGLFRLALGRDDFERILPQVKSAECLLAVGDTLYIGGRQGLQIWDGKHLSTTNVGAGRQGIDNIVRHYVCDEKGQIWFMGRYDLFLFHPRQGKFTGLHINQYLPEKATPSQFDIVNGKCFIGTKADGLYVFDMNTHEMRHVDGIGHIVTSVMRSADGHVCVATNGAGAYLLDAYTQQVVAHFDMDKESDGTLPTNAVNCYYRDGQGTDWFGMVRCGLAYIYHNFPLFHVWRSDGFTTEGINVRSFMLRGQEAILGTHNGFYVVRPGQVSYFSPDMLGGHHIVNNIAYYRGEYYIGCFDGGMCVLNPTTMTLRQLPFVPSLRKSGIGDIEVGPDSLLWVGTSDGLFVIDNQRLYKWYTEQNSHIQGGMILSVIFDRKANAWLTGSSGLSLYSAGSQEIVDVSYPEGFFQHQPWCRGFLGHEGRIFMRNGPQIFYTDEQMADFGQLSLPISLPDVWCREFVDDGKGHYWIASELGLFRMDYSGKNMLRLGSNEGLMGQHINDMQQDSKGCLWVATSEGLFWVSPDELESWRMNNHHRMQLFNICRGVDQLDCGKEQLVNDIHQLNLKWNLGADVLQFDVVLLDFSSQAGRMYEYRVDGSEWTTVLPNEHIKLRKLGLGHHQLEVRLSGVDETTSAYTIVVKPSLWAYIELLLLLTAVGMLYLWYKYRKRNKELISERNQLEEALIEIEEEQQRMEDALMEAEVGLSPSGMDGQAYLENDLGQKKYQKVRVDEEECAVIVKRMRQYVEKNKVYTNPDLKMKDLAQVLRLSPSKLSQVFNLYLGDNYYEFINRYRLEEFKRLIEAGENTRFTITALSERCGFKKSNFFSTFRKVEGMTPSEYLKKRGIKM